MEPKRVVIVGGGFGGLNAAKSLGGRKDFRVSLVDRNNFHLFQPLLYQVAMAGLSPAEIATPIRSVLSQYENTEVLLGEVKGVDLKADEIVTDFGKIPYDYLILACGATHSYFGKGEWEEHAPGLKTLAQATEIRRRVFFAFEKAETEKDSALQKEWLTFVVVGGGPTGVELAGALGEITRFTLKRDFKRIDPRRTRVILIEGGDRLLASMSEKSSLRARRDLEKLGVTVWTQTRVTKITKDGVRMGGENLRARTVIWAAGVKPSPLNESLGCELDSLGRVIVKSDMSLPDHPNVFVIGDQANYENLPGIAPVAIQQGAAVAKVIIDEVRGGVRKPFQYWDKGMMATIGRSRAVVETGALRFGGLLAWLTWLLVHIYYLIGFRNRLLVMINWAWSYLTFGRGARLIVDREWREK